MTGAERVANAGAGRSSYFAYGSNMDPAGMVERCPGARFVGTVRVDGHAFRINGNHHATILPAAGKHVFGVLWSITTADEAALDEYEGVAIALYRRHVVRVVLADGAQCDALTYMARNVEPTRTQAPYFDQLVAAARLHALPEEYVDEIEGWKLRDP